jgi:hypothetical protein
MPIRIGIWDGYIKSEEKMQILAQTDIPVSIISKALESSGFAFLAGVLSGIFIIVKWLDIPDKLLEIDGKIRKISDRQKRIFEVLYRLSDNGKIVPFSMEEFNTDGN